MKVIGRNRLEVAILFQVVGFIVSSELAEDGAPSSREITCYYCNIFNIPPFFHHPGPGMIESDSNCRRIGGQCAGKRDCCETHKNTCLGIKKFDPEHHVLNVGKCGPCSDSAKICKDSTDCCDVGDRCARHTNDRVPKRCWPCDREELTLYCDGNADCCPSHECVKGKCKHCEVPGAHCGTSAECCQSAPMCKNNKCTKCSPLGDPCYSRGTCCDSQKTYCKEIRKYDPVSGKPNGICHPCSDSGKRCKDSADCCSEGDRCFGTGTHRTCLPCNHGGYRPVCESHSDCCPGQECRAGECKPCLSKNKPCTHPDQCCHTSPMCRNGRCTTCVASDRIGSLSLKPHVDYDYHNCIKDTDCCTVSATCKRGIHSATKSCHVPENCLEDRDLNCFEVPGGKHCCKGCKCIFYGITKGSQCFCKRRG